MRIFRSKIAENQNYNMLQVKYLRVIWLGVKFEFEVIFILLLTKLSTRFLSTKFLPSVFCGYTKL